MLTSSLNTPNRGEAVGLQSYAETINVDPSSSSRFRSSLPATAHRGEGTGLTHTAPPTTTMPTLEELLDGTPTQTGSTAAAAAPLAAALSPLTQPVSSAAEAHASASAKPQPPSATATTVAISAAAAAAPGEHGALSPEAASTASTPPHEGEEEGRSGSNAEATTLMLHTRPTTPPPPPATTACPDAPQQPTPLAHEAPSPAPEGSGGSSNLSGSAGRENSEARQDRESHYGAGGGGSPNARRPRHASPPKPPGVLRTSARAASRSAAPLRRHRAGSMTAAQIASLLRGILGTASPADAHAHSSILQPPTVSSLDLPVGLLVLYCAAEETCTAAVAEPVTASASPSRSISPPAAAAAAASSAYSLLYMLEQLSDLRRRDHRREALQRASEMERARCEQLYEAAARKRAADAALQAARAQAVAEEELGLCTFHPAVSPAAQRMEAKGTREFMEKCVEWRAEADRRLKLKYDRIAALEAEQEAAAAALAGVVAPGEAVTEESRRLLAQPSVQERLKTRPCLWEARHHTEASAQPAPSSSAAGTAGLAAAAGAGAVSPSAGAPPPLLLGAPVTSAVVEEQEALLRALRKRVQPDATDAPGGVSALPHDASRRSGASAVKAFLGRVEEDAGRRAQAAAKLQARYHNPESLLFEPGTGKPLFRPNAMPTAHKDGRRVGYDDLSKEEKEDFRAELRRAGLEFVLTHYLRERKEQQQHPRTQSREAPPESNAAGEGGGGGGGRARSTPQTVVTEAQQARFLASLQEAVARRERRLEQIRAQATAEETFHPQLAKRTVKMALRKTGGTPIYERPAPPRRPSHGAATANASALQLRGDRTPQSTPAHRDRPLPEAAELFLVRNEQWTEARQRRLQRTAEMEEARQQAGCTFSPNRDFADAYGMLSVGGGESGANATPPQLPTDAADAGATAGARGAPQARVRPQDTLASAADVRVMNELELLRSGAAYRDTRFVQAVCARTGLGDARRALSNLSLQSVPRLTGASSGAWAASSSSPQQTTASISHSHLSPIQQSSNRPSASPYPVPRRNTRAPSHSIHDDGGDGAYAAAPVPVPAFAASRTQSDTTHTPTRPGSRDVAGGPAPLPLENPWAALDAQTDAILRRRGY